MKNNPLISVVMSVYNGEKYLAEAIESILNQTYKNFEFIIVNDGSKDNSIEIIKNYMKQDNRIVLIDRENKGLPYSLNEGISIAKGEYIARMDADDISLPERFEKQIDFMQKNELDVCGSYMKLFGYYRKEQIVEYSTHNADIKFKLLFMSSLSHPTVIFKKKVFEKVKYRDDYKVAQDYQLWCDIVNADFKIGNIPEVLLNYRKHGVQASIKKSKQQQDTAHEIALGYAEKLGQREVDLVRKIIYSKVNINFIEFKSLVKQVIDYSISQNISNKTLHDVLKKIYMDSNPKSPFRYFIYFANTKDFKIDLNMLLKSFIFLNRNSILYQFLKKLRNNAK